MELLKTVEVTGVVERVIFNSNDFFIVSVIVENLVSENVEYSLEQDKLIVKGNIGEIKRGQTIKFEGRFVNDTKYGFQMKAFKKELIADVEAEKTESIEGVVENIRFKNDQNGWSVVSVIVHKENVPEFITITGNFPELEEGETVEFVGEWDKHPIYGKQFKAKSYTTKIPKSKIELVQYICTAGNIDEDIAIKIVDKFGEDSVNAICRADPELAVISGLTIKNIDKLSDIFQKKVSYTELMTELNSMNISVNFLANIWDKWKTDAKDKISSDPYVMCSDDIGVSFAKADKIGESMGIAKDDPKRVEAGINQAFKLIEQEGSTCYEYNMFLQKANDVLGISPSAIKAVLENMLKEDKLKLLKSDSRNVVVSNLSYDISMDILNRLSLKRDIIIPQQEDYGELIDLEQQESKITYEQKQREAINTAVSKGFAVITGGPGTGKTTTMKAIISIFEKLGLTVEVVAPTGKAAKRVAQLTGYEARTIHRFLLSEDVDDCEVCIIDEMSMVDEQLFSRLLEQIRTDCKLILVGDTNQLPSVGAGNLLKDIIESRFMPTITFTEVFRQSSQNDIVLNAHRIVNGKLIDLNKKSKNFVFFNANTYEKIKGTIKILLEQKLPKGLDIQVIAPPKEGPVGTHELNKLIQSVVNPMKKGEIVVKSHDYTFHVGDKVMQTVNDYQLPWDSADGQESGLGIFNGDIGIIQHIDAKRHIVEVDFDGKIYQMRNLMNLELAYAITVHKSQGSEFDVVIMPIFDGYDRLYYRKLLYTCITRAKSLFIGVGLSSRLNFMIKNEREEERYTFLKTLLCN